MGGEHRKFKEKAVKRTGRIWAVLFGIGFMVSSALGGEQPPPPQPPGPNDKVITHLVGQASMVGGFEYILPTTPKAHIITTPDDSHLLVPPGDLQDGSYSSETVWVREDDTRDRNWYRASAVPGRRVNAVIRGVYGNVGRGGQGGRGGPGGPGRPSAPPVWTTMSVDLDLDADTGRDGPLISLRWDERIPTLTLPSPK